MAFWGIEVKPGKPYTHLFNNARGRLRVSQATLGNGKSESKSVVQCNVGGKSPILLCNLIPNVTETCHLELEFEEDEEVIFSVLGPRSVHLSGYYIGGGSSRNLDGDETDSYGEDIAETDTSGSYSDYGSGDEYDSDFIDDGDIDVFPHSPRRKSGVVIEEIEEEEKPSNGNGNRRRLKKHQLSDSDDANDNSQRQVVARNRSAVLESEDEDGFPICFSSKKKQSEKQSNSDNKVVDEDRKRKIDAISQDGGSTGEPCRDTSIPSGPTHDNDEKSKKKKKKKAVDPAVPSATGDEPSGKLKKKSKKKSAKDKSSEEIQQPAEGKFDSEDTKLQKPEVTELPNDKSSDGEADKVATVTEIDAKKKKKKKSKNNDNNVIPNQEPGEQGISEELKGGLKTRTFANGLLLEELAMGKPDGKRASPGNKVSVNYIGKLKNGTIFDSNVGQRPFKFRLGVGQVIKGWDIGVNGMRVGDKRRLTIPPSFGYGEKRMGKIPANSWLIFDVELVSVQ